VVQGVPDLGVAVGAALLEVVRDAGCVREQLAHRDAIARIRAAQHVNAGHDRRGKIGRRRRVKVHAPFVAQLHHDRAHVELGGAGDEIC
jgi:hypothetical protein